ncbi:hypothetical protein ACHWQZ_G001125 [Mnemiopsis leidyi]
MSRPLVVLTRSRILLFFVSAAVLLGPILGSGFEENCKNPDNCQAGEECRGTCFAGQKSAQYCVGQCVTNNTTNTAVCEDQYSRCTPWLHLCSNSVVSDVCRRSCGLCDAAAQETCRGFMCDGTCVPLTFLCDGVRDCKDNSDEVNCNYFPELWFKGRNVRRCGVRVSDMPETTVQFSKTKKTLNLRRGKSRGRQKRLVHAKHAASYSWPWNGILLIDNPSSPLDQKKKRTFCGVTLIHTDWAITAAHCVVTSGGVQSSTFMMTFGKHYTARTGSERLTNQVRNASRIFFFRDYQDTDIYNDIALLKLNESVVLNDFVNIACLPLSLDVEQFHKTGGVATGWGFDEKGVMARRLKQTLVRPMDRNRCSNRIFDWPDHIPNYFSLGPSLLCTEIDKENGFGVICDGDSGGPMVVRRKTGSYALLGVASFGTDRDCSKVGEAAVYTSVYYYLPWISNFVDVTYI